jgi:hypothetical protein
VARPYSLRYLLVAPSGMDVHDRRAAPLDEALTSPPVASRHWHRAADPDRYSGGVAIGLAFTGGFPMPSLASSRLRRTMGASQDQTDGPRTARTDR